MLKGEGKEEAGSCKGDKYNFIRGRREMSSNEERLRKEGNTSDEGRQQASPA